MSPKAFLDPLNPQNNNRKEFYLSSFFDFLISFYFICSTLEPALFPRTLQRAQTPSLNQPSKVLKMRLQKSIILNAASTFFRQLLCRFSGHNTRKVHLQASITTQVPIHYTLFPIDKKANKKKRQHGPKFVSAAKRICLTFSIFVISITLICQSRRRLETSIKVLTRQQKPFYDA